VNRAPPSAPEPIQARASAVLTSARALPVGTQVEEFQITGVVGEGGFGIVYHALDRSLERRVAVKEYLPWTLASRLEGSTIVTVRTEQDAETFGLGMSSFVNEARLLARFDHPALLKVHRFWEGNGTAYMAMPFYEGPTLKQALAALTAPPGEAWLRKIIDPLLDALSVLHAAQCYHRDISPDNILVTAAGPVLLDFGAARRVINDASRMLTVILKEGYAPIEQYGTSTAMRQGPWTDIYALSTVARFAITAQRPTSAVDRSLRESLEPLEQLASGRYSPSLLAAIDAGMAIRPEERPQTVAEFRSIMNRSASI
jgi:serine/threonine protein kinase